MSYYEPAWDDDGNPEVGYWVKTEPDCPPCGDSGRLHSGRHCPSCDPNRWQRIFEAIRQAIRALRIRRRDSRDEVPF